ncbi:hypothetical protein GQ457_05G028130 [Hibiscus cannabinus]
MMMLSSLSLQLLDDKNIFIDEDIIAQQRFIAIKGNWKSVTPNAMLINVYTPNVIADQETLWADHFSLKSQTLCYWIVRGDFNSVRYRNERSGCSNPFHGVDGFNKFIEESNLIDIPLREKLFTWFGSNNRRCRLDRFLMDEVWFLCLHNLVQIGLKGSISDHIPIVLSLEEINWVLDRSSL